MWVEVTDTAEVIAAGNKRGASAPFLNGLGRLATAAVLLAQLIGSKLTERISFGRPRFLPGVQFRQLPYGFGHIQIVAPVSA